MKTILYVLGFAALATFIQGCVKCQQEEPLVKLTFFDKDTRREIKPAFTSVHGLDRKEKYDFNGMGHIPLDLSQNETTFIFEKLDRKDTLTITYSTELERGHGEYCIRIRDEAIPYTSFDVKCTRFQYFFFGSEVNKCSDDYEIQVYY